MASGSIAYVPAKPAAQFAQAIGVGTKIDAYNPAYDNASMLLSELSTLGIANVRDGTPIPASLTLYVTLARAGVHFDLLESNVYVSAPYGQVNATSDVQRAHQLEAAVPGSVLSLEGTNEYTSNTYSLGGLSSAGNLVWGLADAAALRSAARADPLFAATTLVAPSAVQLDSLPSFGSRVDAGNAHVYGGFGEQLQDRIFASVAYAQASAPGKPVYITETGIASSGYGSSTWGGVADEPTQAIIDVNAVLDGFSAGAAKTFLYELADNPWAPSVQEQSFGLFHTDGTPKPAAIAVGNLMHILADSGAATGSTATTGLDFALGGMPGTASSLLLEKSDGTFELVLWNGRAALYNGMGDIAPPTATVTVDLGAAASAINVYDPMKGAAALHTLAGTNTVTVGLSADPIVIEIAHAAATTPPTPILPSVADVVTSGGRTVITGHAQAGSVVAVKDVTTALGTAVADAHGNWSLSVTTSAALQHHLALIATAPGGAVSKGAGIAHFGATGQSLSGEAGSDVFIGAPGDKLAGHGGADTFVFNSKFGRETVLDFNAGSAAGHDTIVFDRKLFADFASVMHHAAQVGPDMLITLDAADVVTLHGASLQSLIASNFSFF